MKWIISSDPQVFIDASNMSARLQYIHSVTGSEVTGWAWHLVLINIFSMFKPCLRFRNYLDFHRHHNLVLYFFLMRLLIQYACI